MKIGLIQNMAIAGDLSGNLRRVVQSARACIDKGADVLVASAQAIDGAFVGDLAQRSSFLLQAQAALAALAAELSIPLVLASYAAPPTEARPALHPFLLHRGEVKPLRNRAPMQLGSERLYIDVGEAPTPPSADAECGYILHLPAAPWLPEQNWAAQAGKEAQEHRATVITVQSVGCAEGLLLGGGSCAAAGDARPMQLPLFEPCESVYAGKSKGKERDASRADTLLRAVCFWLKEIQRSHGAEGLAVATDSPQAPLLLALAHLAVGSRKVMALGDLPLSAKALAGNAINLSPAPHARQNAAARLSLAEEQGYLLINPLTARDLLLGSYTPPATLHGTYAPLGEMPMRDIVLLHAAATAALPTALRQLLSPTPTPDTAEEANLQLLAWENKSPVEIAARYGLDETQLRRTLRQLQQAPRHSWPIALHMRGAALPHIPPTHRLVE